MVKESSATTKIRPVLNFSFKDFNGYSLNSFVEKGMNLIDLTPRLLLQLRMNIIDITAICKRFLTMSVTSKDIYSALFVIKKGREWFIGM